MDKGPPGPGLDREDRQGLLSALRLRREGTHERTGEHNLTPRNSPTQEWERIAEMAVAGLTYGDMALALCRSYAWVRRQFRSPELMNRIKTLDAATHKRIMEQYQLSTEYFQRRLDEMADEGLNELEELIQSKNERVRLAAVQDILDRNPHTSSRVQGQTAQGQGPSNIQFGVFLQNVAQVVKESETSLNGQQRYINPSRQRSGDGVEDRGQTTGTE